MEPNLKQDELFQEAAAGYGAALDRLASAYEANPEERRDLLQDIHVGLWRSFIAFDGRCSLRTWVYRVAHNIATSHVIRQKRKNSVLVTLEAIEAMPADVHGAGAEDQRLNMERLMALIQRLKPLDRQMTLLYLEGMDAASIGEVMGISAGNVATKIHRIKNILARRFHGGERDAE
ncbi:MAG TPA: sigma-70 family RNA polymerase sigma factor [Bryobacteraceae bacterium]|nr:sigma-70 family RNA polymerase sigma factor [Bryobacteraceae bacterium]